MKNTRQFLNIGTGVAGLLVVILIAVAVNIILGNLNLRVDLTEEKLYTLSEGTQEILSDLERPVTLKFFFNESDPRIDIGIKHFARRVEDLLAEYEVRAEGNILVEKYDPRPDSDAEDWAQRYGIAGQELGMMGPRLYIGLVAVMGDSQAAIPVLDPRAEELLEYNISRMITRVANPEKPVVGVISSLPVLGIQGAPYAMPGQPQPETKPAWAAFTELRQDYDVRELNPELEEIDADVDALVLVHPKELSDATLFAIDQFVLDGGRLMVLLDPLCVTEMEMQAAPSPMGMPSLSSDLDPLLTAWGVEYDAGKVVADLEAISRLRVGQGNETQDSPVWLSLRRNHVNEEDILTSQLESLMMPYAGSFDATEAEGREVTPLIQSSKTSSRVDAMMAQYSADGIRRGFQSGYERLPLAVRLHGTFSTAFPDGKPTDADDADDGADEEAAAPQDNEETGDAFLARSTAAGTVVLVADVDMIYDRFCVREMNFLGFNSRQVINDNLSFFLNAIEQLAGNTALIGIRARGKTERPFDVVLELEREAQEKYLEEERRLQETLQNAQQRLDELQREKASGQEYILTPEQQEAIDNFQQQVLETKRELKLVRRKLRADIERLGFKIKAINILLMPALIALAGIAFGMYRKRKTKRQK